MSASLAGLIVLAFGNRASAADQTYTFDIPAEPLSRALVDFSRQSSLEIAFSEEEKIGKSIAGLHGQYTIAGALHVLLAGTDLTVDVNPAGIVLIRPKDFERLGNCAMWNYSRSYSLLAGVSATALSLCASLAYAQDIEQVTVTGSRVISDLALSPSPITALSVDELQDTTPSNIADALNKLPMFLGSNSEYTPNNAAADFAGNALNMYNFGIQRVLVMLDGHRVAPASANGAVDIDTLPQMLMSRVDVVTGGSGAVYGSDAVTGVVNYILDKHYTGFKYYLDAGTATNNALGTQYRAGLAAGFDLFGGRGHFEGSLAYAHRDPVLYQDMPYGKGGQAWGLAGSGTAANPYKAIQYGRLISYPFGGVVTCGGCAATGMTFASTGVLGPLDPGAATGTTNFSSGGASGSYNDVSNFMAGSKRAEAFGRFSYDITDTVVASVNLSAAESATVSNWYKMQIFPGANQPNTFYVTNPFLSPSAQALLSQNNKTGTFQLAEQMDNFSDGNALATNNFYKTYATNRYLAGTADLTGRAWGWLDWDVYYTHGEARQDVADPHNTNNQKLYAALDAVAGPNGTVVCYVSTTQYASLYPGCVPFNPFGREAPSISAFDYTTQRTQYVMTNILDNVGASVSGDVFDLPAGPVRVALSGESRWMQYQVVTNGANGSDTVDCTGLRNCSTAAIKWAQQLTSAVGPINENVYEFAAETNVPLLKDLPFARDLNVDLAGRYTDYSVSGSAETWKIGALYRVNDNIAFRGSMSADIRAPTLNDLYAPLSVIQNAFTDILTGIAGSSQKRTQGNPLLTPETAHSYTAGVTLTPGFIPNLSLQADYFRIRMANGITSQVGNSTTVQSLCIESGGTSPFCQLIIRPLGPLDPSPANFPTAFLSAGVNSSKVYTEGWNLEANYNFHLADIDAELPGSVSFRTLVTLQPFIDTISYPGAAKAISQFPRARSATFIGYNVGDWSFKVQWTYASEYQRLSLASETFSLGRYTGSFNTFDLTTSKKVSFWGSDANIYLAVQNIFDVQAPLYVNGSSNPGIYYPTNRTYENTIGRNITLGIKGNL